VRDRRAAGAERGRGLAADLDLERLRRAVERAERRLLLLVAALQRVLDAGGRVVLAADDRRAGRAVVAERVRVAVGVVAVEGDRLHLRRALQRGLDACERVVGAADRRSGGAAVGERERVAVVEAGQRRGLDLVDRRARARRVGRDLVIAAL